MTLHDIAMFINPSYFIRRRPSLDVNNHVAVRRKTATFPPTMLWAVFHGTIYTILVTLMLAPSASTDSKTMSVGSTTNVSTSANQACSTTCSSGCMVGLDIGILGVALPHLVACDNATADECLCAN